MLQRAGAVLGQQCRRSLTTVGREGGVATVTLDSPNTRNALSLEMMNKIIADVETAGADRAVRTIVLRGEGKVFSAGHNLKEMTADRGYEFHMEIFDRCERMMLLMREVGVPVVGVVAGQLAAAAGCQLIASCDLVLATPSSQFSTPGAGVGLFCHTPGVPLARRVPRAVSGDMLLTGQPISGEAALRAGLVSRLVEEAEPQAELDSVTAAIASKPRAVVELGKRFYHQQLELPLAAAYSQGGRVMADNLQYWDAQEGIAAFKEKRRPQFCHTARRVE